ncbi:hypothetical protein J6590_094588 [Homalodisca vitripennis]|nr:hypothetical protein J6590_094588 [Homalodisca vitripennis]
MSKRRIDEDQSLLEGSTIPSSNYDIDLKRPILTFCPSSHMVSNDLISNMQNFCSWSFIYFTADTRMWAERKGLSVYLLGDTSPFVYVIAYIGNLYNLYN